MEKLLQRSKLLVLIAVVALLVASVAAFLWGAVKTFFIVKGLIATYGKDPLFFISLIELMDIFLVATALYIFSVGLYELFIKDIILPEWLVIRTLDELKTKLGSIIILVMAVTFLKHLVEWKDPLNTLYFGIAVTFVSATLIAFSHFGKKD